MHGAGHDPPESEPCKHQTASPDEKHGNEAKKVKWASKVAAKKQERQKVEKSPEKLVEPVLAFTEFAFMVSDRDLSHAPPIPVRNSGQIAVSFAINFEVFRGFSTVRLEAAVKVVKLYTGEARRGIVPDA